MSHRSCARDLVLLVATVAAWDVVLFAQGIHLPHVIFDEPPTKVFNVNQELRLTFASNTDPSKLRARIFWGSKSELTDRAKQNQSGVCVYYSSFVVAFSSRNGEVTFAWVFRPYSLKQIGDDGFDNQPYTVVLEAANSSNISEFRLTPKDAASYFASGQDIVLVAPPQLHSGAKSLVRDVQSIRASETRLPSRGSGGAISLGDKTHSCLIVTTEHVADSGEAESLKTVACESDGLNPIGQ
jgi:hypothetical protein